MALPVMFCLNAPFWRGLICYRIKSSTQGATGKPLCFNGFRGVPHSCIFSATALGPLSLVVPRQPAHQIGQVTKVANKMKPPMPLGGLGAFQLPGQHMRHMHPPAARRQPRQHIGL